MNPKSTKISLHYFHELVLLILILTTQSIMGANANLFVSAENQQFDNYMSGPQVIEVVVIDSDIDETDEANGEPDVTINGKILRMVQAVDGHWYGYFADRERVQIADSTVRLPGFGLDYGELCTPNSNILGIDLRDSDGFAIPRDIESASNGLEVLGECEGEIIDSSQLINHVVRQPKNINNTNPEIFPPGQIGIDPKGWPFIQLFDLNPTGNVVVQYNKGGGVQTTTLTFDTVQDFAGLELDRSIYPPGADVHIALTDMALNIDPTDEDSWTFGTNEAAPMLVYQAFDEYGQTDADGTAGATNIFDLIDPRDLMFDDNGQLLIRAVDQQSGTDLLNLVDNDIQEIIPGDRAEGTISAGGTFGPGSQPVTIREHGPNSGVFSGTDFGGQSSIRIRKDALRGKSTTIDYNDNPVSVVTGFHTGSIDIQPLDGEWNSGEEIPVVVQDHDLNKNSRVDENLDLFNPEIESIPSLQIGNPFTLENLESARLAGVELIIDEIQTFSQRAMLRVSAEDISLAAGSTLVLTLSATFANLYESIKDPSGHFFGFNFFNYDIRSLANAVNLGPYTIVITDGVHAAELINDDFQDLINLELATGDPVFGMDVTAKVQLIFTFNELDNPIITKGTVLPIVCDFFSFGKINDGITSEERISNMIVRLELEESGDNSGFFAGSLKFIMLNQQNVLDPDTYKGLKPIAADPTFIIPGGLVGESSPRVNYFEIIDEGLPTTRVDQEEAPTHSGTISFDMDSYKPGETVVVTLQDHDLNLDADLIDIYTVVSPSQFPNDPARDTIGKPGLGTYSSKPLGAIGSLVEVSFDDVRWASGMTENGGACGEAGVPDDGLAATGFTLVETRPDSAIFIGSFRFPDTYCNSKTGDMTSTAGADFRVRYIDFSDVSGSLVEADERANIGTTATGSVALDRTVYPLPFGSVNDFFPEEAQTDSSTPNGRSLFPVHLTGVIADGDETIEATTEEIGPGDLILHIQVTDPDFIQLQSKANVIAYGDHGPVTISILRETETVVLATAGGQEPNSGVITSGPKVIPGVTRELGPIREIEPDSGIFEFDLPVRYTDGPASADCPSTPDLGYSTLNGDSGVLGRFDQIPADGDYCVLRGDIIQVIYNDPVNESGDPHSVTDSGVFALRNGVLQSNKSVFSFGDEVALTLIEPDFNLDSHRAEFYTLDLIEWNSDAATLTMGNLGGQSKVFGPEPLILKESEINSGIFQVVTKIPRELKGNLLTRGEEVQLQYVDWGASGNGYVGQQGSELNQTFILTSLGATVAMDQRVYSWTDKVFLTAVAPDWNLNPKKVEFIGSTDLNPIRIATQHVQLDNYRLAETGTDTGIFTGELILTGFLHDADGDLQTGDVFGFDTNPRTMPLTGGGPKNGFIQSDHNDDITVTFEFLPGEQVVGKALIRWHFGDIQWLESHYPPNRTGTVRVIDADMNLNPELVDSFTLGVSSTTDSLGIHIRVRETNEATGIFEGDVRFTTNEDSGGAVLRVTSGDQVTAWYQDHTPPAPHPPSDHLQLIATTRIGPTPVNPAPLQASNPRVVDTFGNPLDQVLVDQKVQIAFDIKNSHGQEQPFTYFVQVKNEQVFVESLDWVTGSVFPGVTFSAVVPWVPTSPGLFEATLYIWESVENPIPLAQPQTISIQVN